MTTLKSHLHGLSLESKISLPIIRVMIATIKPQLIPQCGRYSPDDELMEFIIDAPLGMNLDIGIQQQIYLYWPIENEFMYVVG